MRRFSMSNKLYFRCIETNEVGDYAYFATKGWGFSHDAILAAIKSGKPTKKGFHFVKDHEEKIEYTDELRKKRSEAGHIAFLGKHHTEESKQKMCKHRVQNCNQKKLASVRAYAEEHDLIMLSDLKSKAGKSCILSHFEPNEKYKGCALFDKETAAKIETFEPFQSSFAEQEIRDLFGLKKDRKILVGKEIDGLKDNVGVEFNGLYWHSAANNTPYNYHLWKTEECEKQEIRLIHIFEDEWRDKKDICISLINSAFGKYEKVYNARDLEFREIEDKQLAKDFLDKNHIQGSCNFTSAYGLFDKEELVQMVCFRKNFAERKSKSIELARMCTKLNCQVRGGFSKLMKHQPFNEVSSFVDRRLFNASGYLAGNWKVIGYSQPSYFYTDFKNRYNRQNFMKQSCLKKWTDCNESMTEKEMCEKHGLYRIYDCGCIKVKWSRV